MSSPDTLSLPLTKFLHPTDYQELPVELARVDRYEMPNGHEHRRWEYAMALRAVRTWLGSHQTPPGLMQALDVGGAGSPLVNLLTAQFGLNTRVVDPAQPDGQTIQGYVLKGGPPVAVVTCVSVLEHVPEDYLEATLSALGLAVKPGGLLFLTADAREREGADAVSSATFLTDDKHFNWMRSRIFDPVSWHALAQRLSTHGFSLLGDADWTYRGPQVYDYTFASMALVKRV